MKHRFIAAATLVALLMALTVEAQPLPVIIKQLNQPADTLIVFAQQKKQATLADLAAILQKQYRLEVTIDEQAYQQKDPKVEIAKVKLDLPKDVGLGLRLTAVLHHCLDELPVQSTYKIQGNGIMIHPGVTQVLQDEDRTGPANKKLTQTVLTSPKEFQVTVADALKVLQTKCGVAMLVSKRKFADEDRANFLAEFVKLPPLKKAPVDNVLRQVLAQANATYQVKYDHVLIIPVKGKGKGKAKAK